MIRERMRLVASSERVKIYCPNGGRFSFFNSPYPAHHTCTALDIYPGRAFGEAAPSPVRGRVIRIRRVMCPKGRYFDGSSFDSIILLESLENPDRLIKILHVEPSIEVGEVMGPGQKMGNLLRSGYFNFWTSPHIHVEVRNPLDPIRARGGFKIDRLIKIDDAEPIECLSGIVLEAKPEYLLISLNDAFKGGIPVDVGGSVGILDAGVPHYGWIGAHMNGETSIGGDIKLCGKVIGTIKNVYGNMCLAECSHFIFKLREVRVGLSLYLNLSSKPTMKIIPPKPGALNKIEKFEEVSLSLT